MDNDLSLLPASALAYTPPHKLKEKTIENAKRIGYLEQLVRAEKFELDRLLANQSTHNKRPRSTHTPISLPDSSALRIVTSHRNNHTTSSTAPFLIAIDHPKQPNPERSSPRGIMDSFCCPGTSSDSSGDRPTRSSAQAEDVDESNQDTAPQRPEMAARGSHWSFIEKARFEAAALKYGPFAWDDIIKAVGTRTEKQVKAYAARYRRRKKLAARMQALPIMTYPEMAKHSNNSFKPPTVPSPEHAVLLAAGVRRQSAVTGPSVPHHYRPVQSAGRQGRSNAAGPVVGAQATRTSQLSDACTESPSRGHGQCPSSLPISVTFHDSAPALSTLEDKGVRENLPMVESALKSENLVTTEPSAKVLKPELICDVLLEAPSEQTSQFYGVPSEVDLLVDQAIGGSEIAGGNAEKPLVMQLDEDAYAQGFADGWLDNY